MSKLGIKAGRGKEGSRKSRDLWGWLWSEGLVSFYLLAHSQLGTEPEPSLNTIRLGGRVLRGARRGEKSKNVILSAIFISKANNNSFLSRILFRFQTFGFPPPPATKY